MNALVCGGSGGIGRAAAEELAQLGANITLLARDIGRLSTAAKNLDRSQNQDHDFLCADFSDSHDLKIKINRALLSKSYHILINNTGGPPAGSMLDASIDQLEQAFHNHIVCNQILVQALVPHMIKLKYGRIINVVSISVKTPIENLGVSNTVRGAVASWSKTLANELGQYNITVNNILPGFTDTARLRELYKAKAEKTGVPFEKLIENIADSTPIKRIGRPHEIAAAIAFLASPSSSFITGVNLPVDGGRLPSM